MFPFKKYPILTDGEIDVAVEREFPGDPARSWSPSYDFRISPHGHRERAGRISLRIGDSDYLLLYAGHIGYGIGAPYRGHRYAAKACRLIAPVALDHRMEVVWITCNPDNIPSRRTCEIVGAQFVEIVDLPPDTDMYRQGERQKCRYRWELPPE